MRWRLPPLPFVEERHVALAHAVATWCDTHRALLEAPDDGDFAASCRAIVRRLAEAGLLDPVLPAKGATGEARFDMRAICVVREGLAYESNLAASLFAIQGMGLSPLFRFDRPDLCDRYVPRARRGESISAIAISEAQGGSDVGAIATRAIRDGDSYRISGEKMWIANGGFADHFLVLARSETPDGRGTPGGRRAFSAFLVDSDLPGVVRGPDIGMIDGFPLATVAFQDVRVPASRLVGEPGEGMKAAMAGFDLFRPSVGAAALGVAKRALAEAIARVRARRLFGKPMAELDGMQARLADMRADVETAALAVYRAAWAGDVVGGRLSTEAALAKLVATEAAQRVVDSAVQIFGAWGVSEESLIGRLYRELRPMRIYEGASEVQKMIIARDMLGERGS